MLFLSATSFVARSTRFVKSDTDEELFISRTIHSSLEVMTAPSEGGSNSFETTSDLVDVGGSHCFSARKSVSQPRQTSDFLSRDLMSGTLQP